MDGVRRRPLLMGAALLALGFGIAIGLVVRHRQGPKHLLTVTPGILYRSGQLSPDQLEDVISQYGIRTVVNLRSLNEMGRGDWYAREVERLSRLGVRLVDLPMNSGFPPSDEVLDEWLVLLADSQTQPLLVHCEYGVIRTGIMVGIYEIEQLGLPGTEALSRFELFGGELPIPIRARIDEYMADYAPRRRPG